MAAIRGINKTSLWGTWKIIRAEIRHASMRDVVDFVDYDLDPDKWIRRLLDQISTGRYEPSAPLRFTLGKSNGFSRTMTMPTVPDLVLYRTIVDAVYRKALKREHKHVYFKRERLQSAQNAAQQAAAQRIHLAAQYRLTSERSFYNWLRYAQYRKYLLHQAVHPFFVFTDVTNFFDSVLHSHVEEALRGLSVDPRMVGLLFFLLERLSVRHGYASSHGISLPVDEFDCSRTLAHLTLFSHDDTMVRTVGDANYVRWMDDQNVGVASRADGLRLLSVVGKSLAELHLSPNTKKSRVLTLREARRHFHLDINGMLDSADASARGARTRGGRIAVGRQVLKIWAKAKAHEGKGEFDKILRRIYRLAGFSGVRSLRRRALADIIANPNLAERVCDYMRCSGTSAEYLRWVSALMGKDEQIYPDVSVVVVESLLRLEAVGVELVAIRRLAAAILSGKRKIPGAAECRALAPLLVLRFADKRSLPLLKRCFDGDTAGGSAHLLRAAAVVYSSYGNREFRVVRRSASRLFRNHLADVVKMVERIREYPDVPMRYRARLALRRDSVAGMQYVDMRTLLTVRLLRMAPAAAVSKWVDGWKASVLSQPVSAYDQLLVKRLV